MASSSSGHHPTIEEQRIGLQMQLALRPNDPYLKQALMRLNSPQQIKNAASRGIFINYARLDELFAMQLAEDLREAGLSVWVDIIDISPDDDWHEAVMAALDRAGLMVTVVSPSALVDADMLEERRYFMEHGKIILPVMYRHCNFKVLGLWNQPIDFRHDYTLGLTILVRLLLSQSNLSLQM